MSGHGSGAGGPRGWERSDVEVKPLAWLAVGLTIMCIVAFVACTFFIRIFEFVAGNIAFLDFDMGTFVSIICAVMNERYGMVS